MEGRHVYFVYLGIQMWRDVVVGGVNCGGENVIKIWG